MPIIAQSIVGKFVLLILLFLLGVLGGFYALNYSELRLIPVEYALAFFGVFSAFCVVSFYIFFARPLSVVLRQMRLLLTGRPYKKIFTKRIDEVGVLAHFFNEVTKNIEVVSNRLKEGEKMLSEMNIASGIQRDILPSRTPDVPGMEIVAKTRFADELGGDCYGFMRKKNKTLMYLGDVTGHGLPAALVMMMVSTLLDTYGDIFERPYDVVVHTNKQLKPRIKATMFMTMVLLTWDEDKGRMTFVGAGHEFLYIYRKATLLVERVMAGGIALGMIPDNSALVKEMQLDLNEGDVILLFSDGITEARNNAGEMYGEDRLEESFREHASMFAPSGVIYHLGLDLARFTGEHVQEDDMSLICIKYLGKGKKAAQTEEEKSIEWKGNA